MDPALIKPALHLSRLIFGVSSLLLLSSCKQNATTQQITDRHIELEGQSNTRDLGGYKTKDGKAVRSGEIFRTGELGRLSEADVEKLASLKIASVVSFLTPQEIEARGADRLPEGVKIIQRAIANSDLNYLLKDVNDARRSGDFTKVPADLNPQFHSLLMRDAKDYYAAFLRDINDPANRPLIFHCSHGVHRTGTAAAILLSALGVPWETIREDYLLSNDYRQAEVQRRLGELKIAAAETLNIPVEQVDTTNMEAFYVLKPEYIDAARNQAIKEYRSMEAYIREGLGFSDQEIQQLRDQLLEQSN